MLILYLCAALCFLWIGVPLLHRLVQTWKVGARCRKQQIVALSFDDGPGSKITPQVLDLLKETSNHATFFTIGRNTRLHPDITKRILEEGHDLGGHGEEHLDAWTVSPRRSLQDVQQGYESIAQWSGHCTLFRPARGRMTLLTWAWLISQSAQIAWWTIDSGDTQQVLEESQKVVDRVIRRRGGVVLLHDFDGSEKRNRYVVEVTRKLLNAAREHGLAIAPLREVLGGGTR